MYSLYIVICMKVLPKSSKGFAIRLPVKKRLQTEDVLIRQNEKLHEMFTLDEGTKLQYRFKQCIPFAVPGDSAILLVLEEKVTLEDLKTPRSISLTILLQQKP